MAAEGRILPAGDGAALIEFGAEIDPEINRRGHAFARRARRRMIAGIVELVPSYCTVLVYFDPYRLSYPQVDSWARGILEMESSEIEPSPTVREIAVLYGGEYGPDLARVAAHNGITPDEVIRLHTRQTYLVYVVGFSPGFAAMGKVPPEIQAPRLQTPRVRVPAGTVGIGGLQTGIYAVESPGGWQLIGRTPRKLFDLSWARPACFQAGDYARFYAIDEGEFREIQETEVRIKRSYFFHVLPVFRLLASDSWLLSSGS